MTGIGTTVSRPSAVKARTQSAGSAAAESVTTATCTTAAGAASGMLSREPCRRRTSRSRSHGQPDGSRCGTKDLLLWGRVDLLLRRGHLCPSHCLRWLSALAAGISRRPVSSWYVRLGRDDVDQFRRPYDHRAQGTAIEGALDIFRCQRQFAQVLLGDVRGNLQPIPHLALHLDDGG